MAIREIFVLENSNPVLTEKTIDELEGVGNQTDDWWIMRSLVRRGFKDRPPCPTDQNLAALIFGGAVIAALTREFVVIKPRGLGFDAAVFNEICAAVGKNPRCLDHRFLGEILKIFFPRNRYAPPAEPHRESYFEHFWRLLPQVNHEPVTAIWIQTVTEDRKFERRLPEGIKRSLCQVADQVPAVLGMVMERLDVWGLA